MIHLCEELMAVSRFPEPRFHQPSSFPFRASASSWPKKPIPAAPDYSFSAYIRPSSDDDDGQGESRAVVVAKAAQGDSELSIFDARKYFNEATDDLNPINKVSLPPVPRFSTDDSSVDGFTRSYRSRSYATPTASSEASWNSHTGLLSNPPGAIPVSLRDPTSGRKGGTRCDSPRWLLFRRKCPCSGKKSVQVKRRIPEKGSPASRSRSRSRDQDNCISKPVESASSVLKLEASPGKKAAKPEFFADKLNSVITNTHRNFSNDGFTFPVLKPSVSSPSLPPTLNLLIHGFVPNTSSAVIASLPREDPPRDSIDVFQPSGNPPDVRRKSRDVPAAFLASPGRRRIDAVAAIDDDARSDASSDLFEIESFSTQSNSTSFPATYGRPRDSLDEARPRFSTATGGGGYGCLDGNMAAGYDTATDCGYEPSEASVTWSVITAEATAFDHASVTNYSVSASDVEEFTRIQLRQHRELEKSSGGGGGSSGGGGGSSSGGGGGGKRRGGGGLLTSCRCEKAVSVGPNPVKYVADKGHVAGRDRHGSHLKPVRCE